MSNSQSEEHARRAALIAAETRAEALFQAIENAGFVQAGRTERAIEEDIYMLARVEFGVEHHWHKRIVRSGPNTLTTAQDDPPVRTLDADDIVYIDLGPVFANWEADIGRTSVLGAHPGGPLVAALPLAFQQVQAHYHATPDITGAELYQYAQQAANEAGFVFGGAIAGHLVSEFPHARIPGNGVIWPQNTQSMRALDDTGRVRHWILEIHLVDHTRSYGGFYERLL